MRSLRSLSASVLATSWSSRYLILFTFCWLSRVRIGLWQFPFQQLQQKLLKAATKPPFYPPKHRPSLRQIIWAVKVSSRLMPTEVKCLAKALTAQAIATQFDYDLDLRIGVAKGDSQQLEAHAWIVYQDRVILGALPDLTRFVPLLSLPAISVGTATSTSSGVSQ